MLGVRPFHLSQSSSNFSFPPTYTPHPLHALICTSRPFTPLPDVSPKHSVTNTNPAVAGALESLSALAHALLARGVATPFLSAPRPHMHVSLEDAIADLKTLVGERIRGEGTPGTLGPVVVGVTGYVSSFSFSLPLRRSRCFVVVSEYGRV